MNLSTFHLFLCIIGYQLFTCLVMLFVGGAAESQTWTIPYRAFALVISLMVIFFQIKKHNTIPKEVVVLFIYTFLVLLRFFLDFYLGDASRLYGGAKTRILMFIVAMNIIPCIAIVKSISQISFGLLLKWLAIALVICNMSQLFSNSFVSLEELDSRIDSFGLGAIGSGHLGLTGFIIFVYLFLKRKDLKLVRILAIPLALLSIYIMLRSGSRGPLLSFIILGLVWFLGVTKHKVIFVIILLAFMIFSGQIIDAFMNVLEHVAPFLYARFDSHLGDQFGTRMLHYQRALEAFNVNPLWGSAFAIYFSNGEISYAHNIFLDSLMQWGIFGGLLILYIYYVSIRKVIYLIEKRSILDFCGLLLIQFMGEVLVSSSFYYTPIIAILITTIFMAKNAEYR